MNSFFFFLSELIVNRILIVFLIKLSIILKKNKTIECYQNCIYSKERRPQFKWEVNKRSFEKHNILLRSTERAPPSNDLRTLKSKSNNLLLHWTERKSFSRKSFGAKGCFLCSARTIRLQLGNSCVMQGACTLF